MRTDDDQPDPIAEAAALWAARRDRGLTPAEQDVFLDWLRADSRHGPALQRLEKAWGALDPLTEWRPAHSARPNPDLLAVPRRRVRRWVAPLAAAAVVALGLFTLAPNKPAGEGPGKMRVSRLSAEVRTLTDGSVVELNHGAEIDVDFSTNERRIRLLRGEAHFTVAKLGPDRPFIVTAGDVRVRAVGTVFNVRVAGDDVEVLVTEGKVRVDPPKPEEVELVLNAVMLEAGDRTSVSLAGAAPAPPPVTSASEAEIERTLAWQGLRVEFDEMPLGQAIAEFNRHGATPLVIADRDLAALRIGGSFRADNAAAFVRLLESDWGVAAEPDAAGRIVLRSR
jgi:transmembrane sensor